MAAVVHESSEVHPAIRAAIRVKIGEIGVTAILDENHAFNAIHTKVFKKICEENNLYNKTYDDVVEYIELDLTIDGRLISEAFRVLKDLYADMVLGEEFFHSVKAHVHLKLGLLKWSYEDELVITDMVKEDNDFRALSGGADFGQRVEMKKGLRKVSCNSDADSCTGKKKGKIDSGKPSATNNKPSSFSGGGASCDLYAEMGKALRKALKSDGDSCTNMKKEKINSKKPSVTNNEPSSSSGGDGGSNLDVYAEFQKELQKALKADAEHRVQTIRKIDAERRSKTYWNSSSLGVGASAAENSKKDLVKIFIAWHNLWDLRTEECLSYYGVSCKEKKILFFDEELLESRKIKVWMNRKTNMPLGHFMDIMSRTFDEAMKNGVKNVHILSDYKLGIFVMTNVQKEYEDFGDIDWADLKEIPNELAGRGGFAKYYAAGSAIPAFESVKFEFVPPEDQTYPEMVRLRTLVEKYERTHPL